MNYQTIAKETAYISTVKGDSTNTILKTIPVDALVHKFYIRQTVTHEVYVGKDWDADNTWSKALENFILNLKRAFRLMQ